MKNGVIRERDFKDHFSYWLDLMAEDGDRMELTKRKVLWDYIREYQFNGVIALLGLVRRVESGL
jgi:hypothetical protein